MLVWSCFQWPCGPAVAITLFRCKRGTTGQRLSSGKGWCARVSSFHVWTDWACATLSTTLNLEPHTRCESTHFRFVQSTRDCSRSKSDAHAGEVRAVGCLGQRHRQMCLEHLVLVRRKALLIVLSVRSLEKVSVH